MARPMAVPLRPAGTLALLWAGALAVAPAPAEGQGFGVYEQGTCVMGRAGAAVAAPCLDGSSIFFNPAALELLGEPRLTLGATAISTGGSFDPDGAGEPSDLTTPTVFAPHAFFGFEPTRGWGLGVGLYAPYGLETRWEVEGFEGRFLGYDNTLRTLYVQPTAAWRPAAHVALGVGLTLAWGEVRLNRRLDLADAPVPSGPPGATFGDAGIPRSTDFADARLGGTSDGLGVGGHFGALVQVTRDLDLGVRYLTSVRLEYAGDADFEPIDPGLALPPGNPFGVPGGTPLFTVLQQSGIYETALADQGLRTSITMPDQLVLGLGWQVGDGLLLAADYQRTGWSSFDVIELDFEEEGTPDEVLEEGYGDTDGVRVGADYRLRPEVTLRAGWFWNEAAAPDEAVTPLLPEAGRISWTGGVGWRATDALTLDLAYMHIDQRNRRGRVRNPPPGGAPAAVPNSGVYSFDGRLVGLTITMEL